MALASVAPTALAADDSALPLVSALDCDHGLTTVCWDCSPAGLAALRADLDRMIDGLDANAAAYDRLLADSFARSARLAALAAA